MVAKKYRIIFIILMFIGVAIFSVFILIKIDKENEQRDILYPILKNENAISGSVIHYLSEHGHVYVTLSDSIKYLIPNSRNYSYKSPSLYDFIHVGDSLVKPFALDTLFVYRNNQKYYFVIGKFIGEDTTPKIFN